MQEFKLPLTEKKLISVQVKKHARSRRLTLKIAHSGLIEVTIPRWATYQKGLSFAESNVSWIQSKLSMLRTNPKPIIKVTQKDLPLLKVKARNTLRSRLEYFNSIYKYKFDRLTIRDQKSRWGSCSSNKTLSFNYRLITLPPELLDYVVVHELCHLKEMNHSSKFWDLVAKALPDYPMRRRELHKYDYLLN